MLTNNTLWALAANTELWYSFDYGTTWNQVDVSGLSGWINGLWGPTNTWKVYVGVADDTTYYYDGSWHLEDSSGPWYYPTRYRPESQTIWCSDDDSIVCAAGFDSSYNNVIRTRDGLPGTAWANEYVVAYNADGGDSYITDIHGTPDGSVIFAIRSYVGSNYDVELLKRDSNNGSWSKVASITDGNVAYWQQVRVISETEVWITGAYDTPNSARIWKWDGTSLSLEYSDTDIRQRGIVGLWMAKDGSEGWAIYQVNGPASESDYFLHYDGSSWSVFQGVQYGTLTSDITQLDDYSTSAITLLINGRYRKYDGTNWDSTYSYSGTNNDIWDEESSAYGLILRYIPYESYDPPFIEGRTPASGGTNISLSSNIECLIVDSNSNIYGNSIDAYVDGNLAYDGSSNTFIAPYDGINSSLTYMPASSIDGYDGYYLVLDRSLDFDSTTLYTVRVLFEDAYGNAIDESWSFTTTTAPITGSSPFITNLYPVRNEPNASPSTTISLNILDADGDLKQNEIKVYVNDSLAFDGYDGYDGYVFYNPYNAVNSKFYSTTVDGYDGYHLDIDSYNLYSNVVTVKVLAEDVVGNSFDGYWGFVVQRKVNSLYFSDGYGLKRVDISELVGETQASSKLVTGTDEKTPSFTRVRTILSVSSSPFIPENNISSIFGNLIDGYFCLVLSYSPELLGTTILKNEIETKRYSNFKSISEAQLNDNGTLYLINETDNQIEVYYGAHFRDGYRSPDFIYNASSTPSIVPGNITELHIASGYSTKFSGGTRIYVGTTQGVTRIEAYDKGTDGYADGYDYRGVSIHYGISGSGLQHEVIGGTVSNVTAIGSDDDKGILFVGTHDGYSSGGVTQISITANRKILFMTQGNGFLPSNNVRNIFGKGF